VSPEETAGSIKMASGVWGAVGPSNHVLDGAPDPPHGKGNFGGDFLPIQKHWDCVLPSVQCVTHDTCRSLAKDAEAIRPVKWVRFTIRARLCNDCGQVDFLATMRPFIELLLVSMSDLLHETGST